MSVINQLRLNVKEMSHIETPASGIESSFLYELRKCARLKLSDQTLVFTREDIALAALSNIDKQFHSGAREILVLMESNQAKYFVIKQGA